MKDLEGVLFIAGEGVRIVERRRSDLLLVRQLLLHHLFVGVLVLLGPAQERTRGLS